MRVSWLVTAQSFLFTAYSLSIPGRWSESQDRYLLGQLRFLIPLVAMFTGALIYLAVLAGFNALRENRVLLLKQRPEVHKQYPEFPQGESPLSRFWLGLLLPLLIPPMLVLAWLYLFLLPG